MPMEFSRSRGASSFAVMPLMQRSLVQRVAGVHQQVDRLEEGLRNDGLHDVELELSGLGRHGDGLVIANDFEAPG